MKEKESDREGKREGQTWQEKVEDREIKEMGKDRETVEGRGARNRDREGERGEGGRKGRE